MELGLGFPPFMRTSKFESGTRTRGTALKEELTDQLNTNPKCFAFF
jgi:hypothetical protein